MLIKHAIFVGSMAALASLTAPALAKHSDAQKTSEQATSSPCSARQRMADGTWNMDAASVSGTGFPRTNTAPIRDAKFGPTNALRTGGLHRAGRPREL
jgi:hypothetical protein